MNHSANTYAYQDLKNMPVLDFYALLNRAKERAAQIKESYNSKK